MNPKPRLPPLAEFAHRVTQFQRTADLIFHADSPDVSVGLRNRIRLAREARVRAGLHKPRENK